VVRAFKGMTPPKTTWNLEFNTLADSTMATAEGVTLANFTADPLKTQRTTPLSISYVDRLNKDWEKGVIYGHGMSMN
jgi:hypothetical protein